MVTLQAVNDLSNGDIKKFIDSLDYVFFDIDGVLVHNKTPIPGAEDGVALLRKLGKKIVFVSNNSVYEKNVIKLNLAPFDAIENEIVTPNDVVLSYLQKIGFKKDIFVIGSSLVKRLLKEAGYKVIDYKDINSNELEETINAIKEISLKTLDLCKNVGAVYVDFDLNFSIGSAQVAKIILNKFKDVLLLTGMNDDTGNISENMLFVGAKFYIDGIERWTNRKGTVMAKPGLALKQVLTSKFTISNDSRVLFIGDNVNTDIAFGVNSGFKTCLLLSGVTSKYQLEKWSYPDHLKPTYVAESLGELHIKVKDVY